jgi:hypothetical protein
MNILEDRKSYLGIIFLHLVISTVEKYQEEIAPRN